MYTRNPTIERTLIVYFRMLLSTNVYSLSTNQLKETSRIDVPLAVRMTHGGLRIA